MRVLFISNFYPPYALGGQEQSCLEVVEGLARRGHQTAVLTSMHETGNRPQTSDGIHRKLYLEMDLEGRRNWLTFFSSRKTREASDLWSLDRLVREFSPDVIFVWGMWNLPRSLAARAETLRPGRVLYRFADYWPTRPTQYEIYWRTPGKNALTRPPKRILGFFALQQMEREAASPNRQYPYAICVSAATKQTLIEEGIPIEHARVIHTGMKVDEFCLRQEEGITEERSTVRLLYAGRLSPEKGVETVIEAFARVIRGKSRPGVQLDIAGTGTEDYQARLRKMIRGRGLADDVSFLGQIPMEEMPGLLRSADILVVPSEWTEPFPRIVMEGMLCGALVLAADSGGIPEIVADGENGVLFEAGDAEDLASKIAQLVESQALRKRVAQAGRKTVVDRFTFESMMDRIEAYLSEIANS